MYQLYKYQQGDEVLYIGQTIRPIYNRIAEHMNEEAFALTHPQLYIAICGSKAELDVFERLLISKYQPPLNTACRKGIIHIDFKEPEWLLFQFPELDDYRFNVFDEQEESLCTTCLNVKCDRCNPERLVAFSKILYKEIRKEDIP